MLSRNPWIPVGVLVAFLLQVPDGTADHGGPLDVNHHDLNVLVYHPLPDHQGDPWGVAALHVNGQSVDWMAGFYGAFDFPTAVFDGIVMHEGLPTLEGAGPFIDTYDAYNKTFHERLREPAPVSVRLDASVEPDRLVVDATVRPNGLIDEDGLSLRFVMFEDDVGYAGGNGIVNHRFVVRAMSSSHHVDLSAGEFTLQGQLPKPPYVVDDNVGVVAIVQNLGEDSSVFKDKEVLQSATWTARQEGPTNQVVRGVLLEMYSATWCAACVYGDSATDALADSFGLQSIHSAQQGFEYLRRFDPVRIGAAIVVGLALLVAFRPWKKPEGSA